MIRIRDLRDGHRSRLRMVRLRLEHDALAHVAGEQLEPAVPVEIGEADVATAGSGVSASLNAIVAARTGGAGRPGPGHTGREAAREARPLRNRRRSPRIVRISGTVAAAPPPSGVHLPATIAAIFWISGRQDARGRMSGSGTLWQATQRALARAWPLSRGRARVRRRATPASAAVRARRRRARRRERARSGIVARRSSGPFASIDHDLHGADAETP